LARRTEVEQGQGVPQDFLAPPPGRRYVRSFLFSRRVGAPFARVHLIARTLLVICLSALLLRSINSADLPGAAAFCLGALLIFLLSGISPRVARIYFLLMLPALLALFVTWIVFNPVPGTSTLLRVQLYAGQLALALAPWQAVFLLVVACCFLRTRRLLGGVVLALLVVAVFGRWLSLPTLTLARVAFFHPLALLVSDRSLLIAITKVIGYAGMILLSISLVMTARDSELIGALRQLRVPRIGIFFIGTVFRSLDLALADFETIRQAQLARAIHARPRSFIQRLRDLAGISIPLIASMLRRSSEIGDALLARGYVLGRASSDFYESSPWRPLDWAICALSLLCLCLAVGPHVDVRTLLGRWR
jgi:energy-coupling factor transporter transmembrane protein EcfT